MTPTSGEDLRQRCDAIVDDAEQFEELRKLQNDWEAIDPDGARNYFKDYLAGHEDSARHHYLYGRLVKGRTEAIHHARRAIELAPDWVYGYRLLMSTYSGCLFRQECSREVQEEMRHELQRDASMFEHVFETTPDTGNLLGYVFEYHLYSGQPRQARAVIKKAKRLKQDWALEHDAVMLARACAGETRPLRRYAADLTSFRVRQGQLHATDRDEAVRQYIVYWFRHGQNHAAGLDYMQDYLEQHPDDAQLGAIHYDIARFHTLLGHDEQAFVHMFAAAEAGYNDLERFECQSCLGLLRHDPRWEQVHEQIQSNWLADRDRRKREALAMEVDEPLPDPELQDEQGRPFRLSQLRGKVLVLEFWATYCRPCRKGMPELSDFSRLDVDEEQVEVIMINVANESRRLARDFVDRRRYKARLLFGDERTKAAFAVQALPTMLIVDMQGRVRFRKSGFHYGMRERLNWWVNELLSSREEAT